eukprot:3443144-Amphidinium_carterae.1
MLHANIGGGVIDCAIQSAEKNRQIPRRSVCYIIRGVLVSVSASSTAFTVLVEVQLKAGIA